MAPKRKITVDLPNTRKSRDRNDRMDRPSSDSKTRDNSRTIDKHRPERSERNTLPERGDDPNRSGDRERTSSKSASSGSTGTTVPNEQGSQRDRDRERGSESQLQRASVFSRLGKGPGSASSATKATVSQQKGICRPWADTGQCPYGTECRFKHVSSLVSPSKRTSSSHEGRETKDKERDSGSRATGHRDDALERQDNRDRHRQTANDRDQLKTPGQPSSKESNRKDPNTTARSLVDKHNLANKLGGKTNKDSPRVDPNWENWDEDNLDYDDELMLEKKRQLLQRELAKQMTVDGGATLDPSVMAPGSSAKGLKVPPLPISQPTPGIYPPNQMQLGKGSNKRLLGDKSSSSSSSSTSTSDSGSSSGTSTSSESSDSDGEKHQGNPKKKVKVAPTNSAKRTASSGGVGLTGHKSLPSGSNSFPGSRRDQSRASSISSSENKKKRKDRSGRSNKINTKKSRSSIGGGKSTSVTKAMGSSKKEKRRSEKKSKNASTKPIPTKREDVRGKSPSRQGEGAIGSLPKSDRRKSNKRTGGFNNINNSFSFTSGQTASKRFVASIGSGNKRRASLSPNKGISRLGKQTRSSSVNLKQQHKFQHRTSKRDKRSISSDRHGGSNQVPPRNRRSSHSPQPGSSAKKRRSSGGQSEDRQRDHKLDRERIAASRDSKNSYTSATGVGTTGRDRDLRRSDLGNTSTGSVGRDYLGRDEKSETKNRDLQRSNNERFDQRGKFGRDTSKEQNKDPWMNNSRNDGNKGFDRRSNERGNNSGFDQRREGPSGIDRDRRPIDRAGTQRDSEKNKGGYDRTPPVGFKNQRDDWNRSPLGDRSGNVGERNRDNWDDGGNVWNRDRGSSPMDRRGGRQRSGPSNTVLSGANSVPVKTEQNQITQRRGKSPFGARERSGRSRSRERLLPPQALNRSSGNISDNRDHNREDRRSAHERERSPRNDRNIRPSGDQFDRKRSSPRDGNMGSVDRFPPRKDRERGGENFDDRHDKEKRKEYAVPSSVDSRLDRSGSRETRTSEKVPDGNFKSLRGLKEGNTTDNNEPAQSDNINKNVDSSKAADTRSSPPRQSTSPSRQSFEKRTSSDSKVGTNDQHNETGGEVGSNQMGTEDYSDFDSDSGEEWLNDMRGEEETEETATSTNDAETNKECDKQSLNKDCDTQEEINSQEESNNDISNKIRKRNRKHDGLLEGISDEDLDDVSDEDNAERNGQKGQSAKLANALGVDWSQLVELQQKQKNQEDEEEQIQENGNATDEKEAQADARRKRWTPIAIFNRIGIPRSYLSDTFYNSFVKKLNDTAQEGEQLELLHDTAGFHMRYKELRERRKNLFVNGPYSRPMLARQEIAIRRELCGLPDEDFCEVPLRPNTDMDLWNKAVQLLNGKDADTEASGLVDSKHSSNLTQVVG